MLLADILHLPSLQEDDLEPATIHLFVVFFCHRLSDYPSIVPSLAALLAMVKFHAKSFNSKYCDVLDIFQTMFKELEIGGLAQTIRQKVFDLFLAILTSPCIQAEKNCDKKSFSIELFESESVCLDIFSGLINAMEGEKDPRCLVAALSMLEKAVKYFSFLFEKKSAIEEDSAKIDDALEKLFDSVACYFPITFAPPSDDPYGVTTEALILALENVLCAHSSLHKHVLPFLVDHLTDELTLGRVQATNILIRLGSSEEYSPKVFRYVAPEDSDEIGNENTILSAMVERYDK